MNSKCFKSYTNGISKFLHNRKNNKKMKEKIEKLKAYMLADKDFTDLDLSGYDWICGRFKGFDFELSKLSTSQPSISKHMPESIKINLAASLLHFGITETNLFKNTKITPSSLDLLAKIVRKSFDEKQITEKRGQEIVDLAFQLGLPNADQIKIDHENNTYTPWI